MSDATEQLIDVLVIGAGPAGIAAACEAAASGCAVSVVDDNPDWGGQIWRAQRREGTEPQAALWLDRIERTGVQLLRGMQVVGSKGPGELTAERDGEICSLRFGKLILATGARELFLPFPGWTLPGVMGAGGLQALVKGGLPIEGKRVVVAGSGPLLLAVAAYLRKRGAEITLLAEQAPLGRIIRFGLSLPMSKARQAVALKRSLLGIRQKNGCWPVSAEGSDQLESVTITNRRRRWTETCDYLACGFGLVPNWELAALLGCDVRGGRVRVDPMQATSVADVYCGGEPTGIGGVDLALLEGQIAGLAAAGRTGEARQLFPQREKARKFAAALDRAFALRDELRELASSETIVCRCEDISHGALRPFTSWRDAKLQTRCGMGPCQGRICGPAAKLLYGWSCESVRPPLLPVALSSLAKTVGGDSDGV
ncbi:MAG: NAD(P)/FAD-dependent oxidoreductase [Planctomycetes bacterium]|nr:NAD(P)/FAD-dependent oxidoreductase [Planctomycetota bacterium]